MKNSGFTLIELLVVISIISLLSTVVMASLNSARTKAQEAAIKQDLQSIKTQAELSYSKTGDYSLVAPEIASIIAHINKNSGTSAYYTLSYAGIDYYDHYSVSVKLNSNSIKNWSVSDQSNVMVWDSDDKPGTFNLIDAKAQCATPVGGIVGRLPTIEELKAFFDASGTSQSDDLYWSSTDDPSNNNNVLGISTFDGYLNSLYKYDNYLVRCVR